MSRLLRHYPAGAIPSELRIPEWHNRTNGFRRDFQTDARAGRRFWNSDGPFAVGDLHEAIRAWLGGNLERDGFAMPG